MTLSYFRIKVRTLPSPLCRIILGISAYQKRLSAKKKAMPVFLNLVWVEENKMIFFCHQDIIKVFEN